MLQCGACGAWRRAGSYRARQGCAWQRSDTRARGPLPCQDFFHPRFSLSNPDAFDKYLCVQASLAQQNKLSHYLDLVEVDLLRHIGQRSNDFFTALSTFQVRAPCFPRPTCSHRCCGGLKNTS